MTDTPRLLQAEFEGFMSAIQLADADPLQKQEMKRAFFAGARAYSAILFRFAEDCDEVTDGDVAIVEAMECELTSFAKAVERGAA